MGRGIVRIEKVRVWNNNFIFPLFRRLVNRINDIILAAIPTIGITSTEFFNEVQSFFKDKTDHFVSELLSFARSPHDIIAYDRYQNTHIQYTYMYAMLCFNFTPIKDEG